MACVPVKGSTPTCLKAVPFGLWDLGDAQKVWKLLGGGQRSPPPLGPVQHPPACPAQASPSARQPPRSLLPPPPRGRSPLQTQRRLCSPWHRPLPGHPVPRPPQEPQLPLLPTSWATEMSPLSLVPARLPSSFRLEDDGTRASLTQPLPWGPSAAAVALVVRVKNPSSLQAGGARFQSLSQLSGKASGVTGLRATSTAAPRFSSRRRPGPTWRQAGPFGKGHSSAQLPSLLVRPCSSPESSELRGPALVLLPGMVLLYVCSWARSSPKSLCEPGEPVPSQLCRVVASRSQAVTHGSSRNLGSAQGVLAFYCTVGTEHFLLTVCNFVTF